jgi:hypothetical protein
LVLQSSNHVHVLHMIDNRVEKHPEDLGELEGLAVIVVSDRDLALTDTMSEFHWNRLARALLPKHVRPVARALFARQANRRSSHFFLEHSSTQEVLEDCIKQGPLDVWEELVPFLVHDVQAQLFAIGFPSYVMDQMPREAVLQWIAEAPVTRAIRVAKMSAKNFADTSLAAAILERWDSQDVRAQLLNEFMSGGWSGDASLHWDALASQLDAVARESKLSGVKRWARDGALELRRMAEHERKHEAEERVRGWS